MPAFAALLPTGPARLLDAPRRHHPVQYNWCRQRAGRGAVFVAHPEINLDNNAAENAVRGPVVGRKNYYGSGSIWSARFAASMFTVLLTLDQVWAINTRLWMTEFLQACAVGCGTPPDLSIFLPWTMTPERLAHFGGKLPAAPPGVQPRPADTS